MDTLARKIVRLRDEVCQCPVRLLGQSGSVTPVNVCNHTRTMHVHVFMLALFDMVRVVGDIQNTRYTLRVNFRWGQPNPTIIRPHC